MYILSQSINNFVLKCYYYYSNTTIFLSTSEIKYFFLKVITRRHLICLKILVLKLWNKMIEFPYVTNIYHLVPTPNSFKAISPCNDNIVCFELGPKVQQILASY